MFLLKPHSFLNLSCFILLLSSFYLEIVEANTKPGCQEYCGNIQIPYPFGIGEGCYLAKGFDIYCNNSDNPPRPFLGQKHELELLEIYPTKSPKNILIKNFVSYYCFNESGKVEYGPQNYSSINLTNTPFTLSYTSNKFTVIGCHSLGLIQGMKDVASGCVSLCERIESVSDGSCSGLGCCQYSIPKGIKNCETQASYVNFNSSVSRFNPCGFAFLAGQDKYVFEASDLVGRNDTLSRIYRDVPVVLDFAIENKGNGTNCAEAKKDLTTYACQENSTCDDSENGSGYVCSCKDGYEGNPYLSPGCQDINECGGPNNPCEGICTNTPGGFICTCPPGTHNNTKTCIPNAAKFPIIELTLGLGLGFLFFLIALSWLYYATKKRKLMKIRQQFFRQNGGLLLQQHLAYHEGSLETTKIFTAQELQKATDNYAESRILGRGGNGTVYKGFLSDNRIVAIKKSKIVDKSQIEQFINEVVILTQINHRNVVKLLGCCLETEVPLLVYEFFFNGSLYHHIHNNKAESLSWDVRLKIATETASALAYLHSATSVPIIHRDVKSANILLDDKYIAKVSDFGTSRLIPIDQTQITTLVQGTLGYLDPEYFQTSQLTEKSDVYSLGVVLVELLTGEMPISFGRPEAQTNLSSYFILSMQQHRLFQIVEAGIMKEGNEEQVIAVAELAKRCLKLKGEERPTMKEVVTELEGLRRLEKHPWVQSSHEEAIGLLDERTELNPVGNSSLNPPSSMPSGLQSGQYNRGTSLILSPALPR